MKSKILYSSIFLTSIFSGAGFATEIQCEIKEPRGTITQFLLRSAEDASNFRHFVFRETDYRDGDGSGVIGEGASTGSIYLSDRSIKFYTGTAGGGDGPGALLSSEDFSSATLLTPWGEVSCKNREVGNIHFIRTYSCAVSAYNYQTGWSAPSSWVFANNFEPRQELIVLNDSFSANNPIHVEYDEIGPTGYLTLRHRSQNAGLRIPKKGSSRIQFSYSNYGSALNTECSKEF